MALITYVAAPGGGKGIINAGDGTNFDVGAQLLAGGGQFTVDSAISPVLVNALDGDRAVTRSGVAPGAVLVPTNVGPLQARTSANPQPGETLVRGADGVFAPAIPVAQTTSLVQNSGHSLTNGYGLADSSLRASSRLAGMIGSAQEQNMSMNGAVLGWPDTATGPGGVSWMAQRLRRYRRRAPFSAESDVVVMQWGKNDANQLCQNPGNSIAPPPEGLALFKNALTTAITLFRSSARFYAGDKTTNLDVNVVLGTPGNWTAVPNAGQPSNKRGSGAVSGSVGYLTTTTNGAGGAVALTVDGSYPGSAVCPLYVMFVADPNLTAGTITASGAAAGTFDLVQLTNAKPGTCDKANGYPGLVVWRFTGNAIAPSNGIPQTLTLTPSALAGGTWGLAEFGVEAEFPPIITVYDISKDFGGGNPVYSKVANTDLTAWNAGIQAVVASFVTPSDANTMYVPLDALIGGLGETASVVTNQGITPSSPANGGTLTVLANSLPAAGAMFLPFATGEVITWAGGGGTTTLTGVQRGCYGTTPGTWTTGSTFWLVSGAAAANFYLGGTAGDGLHWSERAQSIAAGAVYNAIRPLLGNSGAPYRTGPGRIDARCSVTSSAEQLVLAGAIAGQPVFFNQSLIDTAAMQDPTTPGSGPGNYTRVFAPSDGLYLCVAKAEFSQGKRVSAGATAVAGMRYITLGKNLGGALVGGAAIAPCSTFPTTADQSAFFGTYLTTFAVVELRVGDYLQMFCAATGAGVSSTITNNPLTFNGTNVTLSSSPAIANNDYIRVDDEIMLVTAAGGTASLTVTRGQLGTAAVQHAAAANVYNGVSLQNPTLAMTRLQAI